MFGLPYICINWLNKARLVEDRNHRGIVTRKALGKFIGCQNATQQGLGP